MSKKRLGLDDVSLGSEHLINPGKKEESKMAQILFKCTDTQKNNIKKAARNQGLTVSGYIKMLLANDGGLN